MRKQELFKIYKEARDDGSSWENLISEGLLFVADHFPYYKAKTIGEVYNQANKDVPGGIDLLKSSGVLSVFVPGSVTSPTSLLGGKVNKEEYVVGMYILLIENKKGCSSKFIDLGDGVKRSVLEIHGATKIHMSNYSRHIEDFCKNPQCWKLLINDKDRFILGGKVPFGTLINSCAVTSTPSGGGSGVLSATLGKAKGLFSGCDKKSFDCYFEETEGRHYSGPNTYFCDEHHGVDKTIGFNKTSRDLINKFFEYTKISTKCGDKAYTCDYDGWIKWYFDHLSYGTAVPGEMQPFEAYELLSMRVDGCNRFIDSENKQYPKTPSTTQTTPPPTTPTSTTPPPTTPTSTTQDEVEVIPEESLDCKWEKTEVSKYIDNLMTGNKPFLGPGSKGISGSYTLGRREHKILGLFDSQKNLTGAQLRKDTKEFIKDISIKGPGRFFALIGPNKKEIDNAKDVVFAALSNLQNSPSTGDYKKFCHENKEVESSINRAKVYLALLNESRKAKGKKGYESFSGMMRIKEQMQKDRDPYNPRRQVALEQKDIIDLSTAASNKYLRKKELLKISSKIK